jgi:hypothetical protein
MAPKDTLNRAYGNAPKDIPSSFDFFDWIPTRRAVRYVWIKWVVRKIFK